MLNHPLAGVFFISLLAQASAFCVSTPAATTSAGKYKPESLVDVVRNVKAAAKKGQHPVVVFDLDDTLFNARSRTFKILKDHVKQDIIRQKFPEETRKIENMKQDVVAYQMKDTLKTVGIQSEEFTKGVNQFWSDKFFSNEYCAMDQVIAGAPEYVNKIHAAGGTVVYLTGRDKPRMEDCTIKSLRITGFPLGKRAKLVLKPHKDMPDLQFKEEAFATVNRDGLVVGGFENEPANLNAMETAFPTAALVFLDTAHSGKPVEPSPKSAWVADYETRKP